jgi:hypothetical protein
MRRLGHNNNNNNNNKEAICQKIWGGGSDMPIFNRGHDEG